MTSAIGSIALELQYPERLALLALFAAAWAVVRWRRPGAPSAVACPTFRLIQFLPRTVSERIRHLPGALRVMVLTLVVVALAGPVVVRNSVDVTYETTDIVFLVDTSASMLAEDLSPNRLGAAQRFIEELVRARPRSRFGLVTFAASTSVECPVTTDHGALLERLRAVNHRQGEEGTALGGSIAECCRRMKTGLSEARAIVLLSDGANNSTGMTPELGARLARSLGIRVHTVGLGGSAPAPYPTEFGMVTVTLAPDYGALMRIASATDGKFFKAADASSLGMALRELDRIDSTERRSTGRHTRTESGYWFAVAATICLAAEMLLRARLALGAAG
jgi:Ca-activated chloride channel family protein